MQKIILVLIIVMCNAMIGSTVVFALSITAPSNGETFLSGGTITLRAEPGPGENIHKVGFTGNRPWAMFKFVEGAPFEVQVEIPTHFVRSLTFIATGFTGGRTDPTFDSEKITVQVVLPPNVTLQGLRVDPLGKIHLDIDPDRPEVIAGRRTNRIAAIGRYSDGVERDIPAAELTLEVEDPTIATVEVNDKWSIYVRALKDGNTSVIVRSGAHEVRKPVQVHRCTVDVDC